MTSEMFEIDGLLYGPYNDTDKRPTLAHIEEMIQAERKSCAGEIETMRAALLRIADPWGERQADNAATIIHLANIARTATGA